MLAEHLPKTPRVRRKQITQPSLRPHPAALAHGMSHDERSELKEGVSRVAHPFSLGKLHDDKCREIGDRAHSLAIRIRELHAEAIFDFHDEFDRIESHGGHHIAGGDSRRKGTADMVLLKFKKHALFAEVGWTGLNHSINTDGLGTYRGDLTFTKSGWQNTNRAFRRRC